LSPKQETIQDYIQKETYSTGTISTLSKAQVPWLAVWASPFSHFCSLWTYISKVDFPHMGISKTNESNIAIHVVSKEIQLVPDI
jgi:hypothetical protein